MWIIEEPWPINSWKETWPLPGIKLHQKPVFQQASLQSTSMPQWSQAQGVLKGNWETMNFQLIAHWICFCLQISVSNHMCAHWICLCLQISVSHDSRCVVLPWQGENDWLVIITRIVFVFFISKYVFSGLLGGGDDNKRCCFDQIRSLPPPHCWIFLKLLDMLHGFLEVVTWICQSWYTWISLSCFKDFFKIDTWISLSCYMDFL